MAAITVLTPTLSGVAPSPASASGGGDTVANPRGDVLLRVINGGGSSINVTVTPPASAVRPADGSFPQMTLAANVVAVPAGASRIIGPFPPMFNNANGNLDVTYSSVTSVTVEAMRPGA